MASSSLPPPAPKPLLPLAASDHELLQKKKKNALTSMLQRSKSTPKPHEDTKFRSLSRKLITLIRRNSFSDSEESKGPNRATVIDPVIVFDPSNATNQHVFAIATTNGIRQANEDRHRVISDLELFARAVLKVDRNIHDLHEIVEKKLLEQYERESAAPSDSQAQEEHMMAPPSFNLRKLQKQQSKKKTRPATKTEFYGIYDGHGGASCSSLLALLFPLYLLTAPEYTLDLPSALLHACRSINHDILQREATDEFSGGSTAITLVIRDQTAYLCHTGDCRAILLSKTGVEALTIDHRAGNEVERKRIEDAGGMVLYVKGMARVSGRLAVSRAFGDVELQDYVNTAPDIIRHQIRTGDEYLVLASDGLWDTMTNEQVQAAIRNHPWLSIQELTQLLMNRALEQGSLDNITVLIVDLRR